MSAEDHGGADIVVTLPDELRSAFKEPMGTVYTDPEELLEGAGSPLIAVGDIVTYHFERVDYQPDVALVDGRTKRRDIAAEVRERVDELPNRIEVVNPAGTLSAELLSALERALAHRKPTTIVVDGEEDLATLPAVLVAPVGASVVYGQPDEGMVEVTVTKERKTQFRALLERMDGDHGRLWTLLE